MADIMRPLMWEEWRFAVNRPDLPPCERCDSGKKCHCAVYRCEGWCGCMGFTGCPECERGVEGYLKLGEQGRALKEAFDGG